MKVYRIILLGAYGFTAKKIARKLNQKGIHFSVAGRDREHLKTLQEELNCVESIHVTDIVNDLNNLVLVLKEYDLLINCIGPYNYYGHRIIESCINSATNYIDISGEQYFVKRSFEEYSDKAKKIEIALIHAMAFESALADYLANKFISSSTEWKEISTFYNFKDSRSSPGTKLTMGLSRYFPTFKYENRKLSENNTEPEVRDVILNGNKSINAALFVPYPEIVFFSDRYKTGKSSSYILSNRIDARFAAGAHNRKTISLEEALIRHKRSRKRQPTDSECKAHQFDLFLYAKDIDDNLTYCSASGFDPYGFTASIVAENIQDILNTGISRYGALSPISYNEKESVFGSVISESKIVIDASPDFRLE